MNARKSNDEHIPSSPWLHSGLRIVTVIGLINANNVARVSTSPTPGGAPETTLPMDLLRWTRSQINTRAVARRKFIYENEN